MTRGTNKSQIQYGDSPGGYLFPCSPEINVHTNSLPPSPYFPKNIKKSFLMFPAPPILYLFPCSPHNLAINSYFPCNKSLFPLFPKPLGLRDLLAILMTHLVLCHRLFACWAIFIVFFVACWLFSKLTFPKYSFYQTFWIQIRTYTLLVLIWTQTVCKGHKSADDISRGHIQLARTDVKELHDVSE